MDAIKNFYYYVVCKDFKNKILAIEREEKRKENKKTSMTDSEFTFIAFIIACVIMFPVWLEAMITIFAGTSLTEYIEMVPAFIILVPIVMLILGLGHSSFYTGIIYKRDKENKPKRAWL